MNNLTKSLDKKYWLLEDYLAKGASDAELLSEVNRLGKALQDIANNRPTPPASLFHVNGSRFIGSGWEWAVYSTQNSSEVIKVPSGAFPEVSEAQYLEKTISSYNLCKDYLGRFILNSTFERINTSNGQVNTIRQQLLKGENVDFVDVQTLSQKTKMELIDLAFGVMWLIKEKEWAPDLYLREKMVDGKRLWKINNVIIEDGKPAIFDFTSYFDQWRLYPDYTAKKIISETALYSEFLLDLGLKTKDHNLS